jgi:glycosyltransferase involved in cell wall biosynthesis
MLVSFVIPCFNAIDKIGRCMASLERLNFDPSQYEVLFIDDCSTDGTDELTKKACEDVEHWHFIQLEKNSGSPSRPRNKGIEKARGKYIYFLDCDDEILPDALTELTQLAEQTQACVIRSELLAEDGKQRKRMNQIDAWHGALSKTQRAELIIQKQSTVPTSLIKAELLRKHDIRWAEHLRMGEDTVFLANILAHAEVIEYLASPTYVYFKIPSMTPASTQRYGRRELTDHLEVWSTTQKLLEPLGINYIETRLGVGLRVAIESLIFRSRGDLDERTVSKFSSFLNDYWHTLGKFKYTKRISDVIQAAKENDYKKFVELTKPRLLIAGHDLKFIDDAVPELSQFFDIRLDEWKGHASHDEKESRECLEWAEYIWCEWLLGNAEWYAANKKQNQKLVVRMHRMELSRNHGEVFNVGAVDAVVAVSPFFFERMLERFTNIPRHKARLIYNYVRASDYEVSTNSKKLHTLGMIGILPSKKGFKDALVVLNELRNKDSRFRLKVFGKKPSDLHWIARDPQQMAYYKECDEFIADNGLSDCVEFLGHVDIKKGLAKHNVGYVLSMSERDLGLPGFESFHLAIADGFCAGAVSVIRHWPGAEIVWPNNYICQSEGEIVNKIASLSMCQNSYTFLAREGQEFVSANYDIAFFSNEVNKVFLEL